MIIIIKLRDGNINIPYKYFEKYLDIDWFFSNLIKYSFDNEKTYDSKENNIIIEIFESKNVVISLFDSIRFQKLVIHSDVSLEYLYTLADYWCAPEWIKDEIDTRDKLNPIVKSSKKLLELQEYIFRCKNCYCGFKLSENESDSCKTHTFNITQTTMIFACCGGDIDADKCRIGYQIPPDDYIEVFNNYIKLID